MHGRLLVIARRVAYGVVCVEAIGLRSGEAVWRHSPVPEGEFGYEYDQEGGSGTCIATGT